MTRPPEIKQAPYCLIPLTNLVSGGLFGLGRLADTDPAAQPAALDVVDQEEQAGEGPADGVAGQRADEGVPDGGHHREHPQDTGDAHADTGHHHGDEGIARAAHRAAEDLDEHVGGPEGHHIVRCV